MNKSSSIAEKLVELISPIVDVSYIQAEVTKYPYCAYDIESLSPQKTKHGVNAWNASVSVYIVTKKESQADSLKKSIIDAIKNENKWVFNLQDITANTDNGHWAYRLEYSITQIL